MRMLLLFHRTEEFVSTDTCCFMPGSMLESRGPLDIIWSNPTLSDMLESISIATTLDVKLSSRDIYSLFYTFSHQAHVERLQGRIGPTFMEKVQSERPPESLSLHPRPKVPPAFTRVAPVPTFQLWKPWSCLIWAGFSSQVPPKLGATEGRLPVLLPHLILPSGLIVLPGSLLSS